ncbi:putative endo-beta-galactosidase [Pedobacter sp. BAL39]|uniref:family 16 glycosylhydrolase n=1 Tax=Pedobacter sp. BAL39 TaxID=391596 RepID=UPI0001559B0B|nr:family 16 glycosylhydrolase [Pedobacter sp. BAL39]EDM36266.1 putative endo-beta-galactosidase [Pedobacter sp. BAL39]
MLFKHKSLWLQMLTLMVLVSSCKKEKENEDLMGWVSSANSSVAEIFASDVDETKTLMLSVTKGGIQDFATTITFQAAPEALDSLNRATNANYVLLPESCYSIEKSGVSLPEGQKTGAGILTYNPHKIAQLQPARYVLPVSFRSSGMMVNPDKSRIIYAFSVDKLGNVIFEDNFEQTSAIPDPNKWSLCDPGTSDWNRYLSKSYDHVYVDKGMLVLKAEIKDGKYQTSGLESRNKFSFQYGKVEVRAKFTKTAKGGWPAIWLMPQTGKYPGGWPYGGEIDIMEQLNHEKIVHHTVHSHFTNILGNKTPEVTATSPIVADDFNVYGMKWNAEEIVFMVNGRETFRYKNLHLPDEAEKKQWPFDVPFYVIFDYAVGGPDTWPGLILDSELPAKMEIDWIRVSH